jgi:hypothetical protein
MTPRIVHAPYLPSGGVRSFRLPIVLIGLVATSIGIGAFYFTLLSHGWYLAALSVLVPVMIACGYMSWCVRFLHCRNRVLAGTLGASCALLGLAVYFHIDQHVRWQVPLTAVERLPGYIAFRMETDLWVPYSKGAILVPQARAEGMEPVGRFTLEGPASWNWRLFLFEALALTLAALVTGLRGAKRPYSERWHRWCDSESLFLTKDSAAALRKSLGEGTVEEWVEAGPRLVSDRQRHCKLKLWYSPSDDPEEGMADVLISLNDEAPSRLKTREASAFVNLLPAIRSSCGVKPLSEPPSLREFDSKHAYIWKVPKASRGRRMSLGGEVGKAFKGLRMALPIGLLMFSLTFGAWCLNQFVVLPGMADRWIVPAYILGLGLPVAIWIGLRWPFQRLWQSHLDDTQRALIHTIASRHDAIVRANDPSAIYAEMLPRRLWEAGGSISRKDSNEGLMRLAEDRAAVLFEGENQRFLIPADSIVSAKIESLPGVWRSVEGLFCVVLRVKLESCLWELPFFPLRGLPAKTNWQRAAQLLAALEELCGRQLGDEAIEPTQTLEPALR